MEQQLVSDSNKEFLEDVSPSRLQHCISELFCNMLARRDDQAALLGSLEKKIKEYSKHTSIKLLNPDEDPADKVLLDLKEKEKNRCNIEDDFLDELRIYDLTVVREYWVKYCKKMLNILIETEGYKKSEISDPTLMSTKTLPCFHLNYIMSNANTDCDTFELSEETKIEHENMEKDEEYHQTNKIFLNEETIDIILKNYSAKKFTFHELLCKLVEKSREKLGDKIHIYSADLNTIYRRGPPGKGKKLIFKWLQSMKGQNKENEAKNEDEEGEDPKTVDEAECYYKILSLHNSKVAKILKTSYEAHEDRKNGVIRIPTPAQKTKPAKGKGKKKKPGKKNSKGKGGIKRKANSKFGFNSNIEFTMVVKGEENKVEEIPVKADKKAKKNEEMEESPPKALSSKENISNPDEQPVPDLK